jgi:DNA-binding XRE family transcriptional regulator
MPERGREIDALMQELRVWVSESRGRQMLLARAIGASKQTVSAWVKGVSVPTFPMGLKLQAFLKAQKPPKSRKVAA